MSRAAFALAALGLTGTVLAETPEVPQPKQLGRVLLVNGTRITLTYGPGPNENWVARLSGGVIVDVQGTTIAADEATVDMKGREVRLIGDMRIKCERQRDRNQGSAQPA